MRLAATIGILLDALDALVAAQCDVATYPKRAGAEPIPRPESGRRCASARSISATLSLEILDDEPADTAARPSARDRRPQAGGGAR